MKLVIPFLTGAALATNQAQYGTGTAKNILAHFHNHGSEQHEGVPWDVDVQGSAATVFDPASNNKGFMSTGEEVIIPINVHDPTDKIATTFFNTTNHYIRQDFSSWHDGAYGASFGAIAGPYVYEAHYRGRETEYYNSVQSANFKPQAKAGWNAIASDTGLQITWEGDLEACTNIEPTAQHSNQECTFDKANEYCHRHAGELFIPGEYYWHFFFNPMCSEIGSASVKSGANVLGATYSNSDYWVNLRREVVGSELNVETSSKFHFFDQLNKLDNVYTGWDSNQSPVETGEFSNVHQQIIKSPNHLNNKTHEFFTLAEFKDLSNHQKICGDCNYNYNTSDQKAYAQAYTNTLNGGSKHLNMKYISQHIDTGGYASKPCAKMYCGPDQTEPKVQDAMCDHNNIRPMCIIRNPLGYKAYCPKELGIDQCGEKVIPVIVASVYGSQATPKHEWGNSNGGDVEHNFINSFKAVADQMKAKLTAQGDNDNAFMSYQSPTMYLNCLGNCTDQTDGSVVCDASSLSSNQRQLCGTHGVDYAEQTAGLFIATYSRWATNTGFCQCECSAAPTWSPEHSLATTGGSSVKTTDGQRVFCCDVGYTMVSDVEYAMKNGCIVLDCDDFSTTAEAQYTPFYENLENNANIGAGWKSGKDFHDSIQAKCVPASCPAPPSPALFNGDFTGEADEALRGDYTNSEIMTYPCPANACGTVSSTCVAGVADGIKGGKWTEPSGTCTPRFCDAPSAKSQMSIDVTGQMADGDQFNVKCADGFGLYKISTGKRVPLNNGQGTCDAFAEATCSYTPVIDYECRPLKCVDSNPCGNSLVHISGKESNDVYNIGQTVTCDCLLNLQAQNKCESECVFVDGDESLGISDTVEFRQTKCQCTDPECPAAANVPHGVAINAGHEGAVTQTPYLGNKIQQGHFISYQCDAGYALSFTATDQAATWQECVRECHTPYSCSDPEGHGFPETDKDRFPVLDPLACYCKPTLCPKHDIAALPAYNYAKPGAAEDTHVSMPFFNTIDVVCKSKYFNRNGNKHETVNCDNGSWTTVDTCVELTCADPRQADSMSPTVNLEHTCKHLDAVNINGDTTANEIIKDLVGTAKEVKYGDTVATPERLVYGDPRNNASNYFVKKADGNIKDGSVQTFTCKPGFKPYMNFPTALAANNFEAGKGQSFDCTCAGGKWVCTHSCRCDTYCPSLL